MPKVIFILLLLLTKILSQNNSLPRFIVTPWTFFDICDLNNPFNQSSMSGIEVNVVSDAFKIAGYVQGQDFVFECIPWPQSYSEVYQTEPEDDNVIALIAGLPIVVTDMLSGLTYSQGTLQLSFGIGYFQSTSSTYGIANWFYVLPFTTSLYLVMLAMPLLFAILFWYFEGKNMPILNYFYHLIIYYYKLDFLKRLNAESRLIEFFFQIYCLVVIIAYSSNMVFIISNLKSNGGVNTMNDLRGLRIAALAIYTPYVSILYGRPVAINQTIQLSTLDDLIYVLENQDIPYFLFESPVVQALAAADCRFSVVLTNVIQFDYGILWSKSASQDMIEKMDIALVEAFDEKNQSVRLAEGLAAVSSTQCLNPTTDGSQQILLGDVYGLWVIWCLCLSLGILIRLFSLCKRRNGRSIFNCYDLEIRGQREKMLIGAVNSQTACIAMVSKDMIQKTREQAVATYNSCFNMMKIPLSMRIALLSIIENDPDFKDLIEPRIVRPTKHFRKSLIISWGESIFKRVSLQSRKQSIVETKSPKIQILDEYQRSPTFPKKRSRFLSIDTENRSLSQLSMIKNTEEFSPINDLLLNPRQRLSTNQLVSNLRDKLLKFTADSPQSIHYELTAQKARELADYYYKRSIDLESDLQKLKEEQGRFKKDATKKSSAKTRDLKFSAGLIEAIFGIKKINSDDLASEDESSKSENRKAVQSFSQDKEIPFGSRNIRKMSLNTKIKRNRLKFGLPPSNPLKMTNHRKDLAPFAYKKNHPKFHSDTNSNNDDDCS